MTHASVGSRCAALVGPGASGKTTLLEELLFAAGAIDRRGSLKDGSTVGDAAPEARRRAMSTELSVASFEYLDQPWALIDCPGSVELAFEAQCAMAVADAAVVVCTPQPERAVTVSPLLRFLDERNIPHLIFINKMDQPKASVRATLEALQGWSHRPLVLREIPMRDAAGQVTGMIDLVSERVWRWQPHQASALVSLPEHLLNEAVQGRSILLETLADFDDRLMEELLEDVVPSTDAIYQNLTQDLQKDLVVPVFFGSAENGHGVHRLLKALRHEVPGPDVTAARRGIRTDRGATAEVFRTQFAGQAGKLSLARIWAGEVRDGMSLGPDRIGGISRLFGRRAVARRSAAAGEVVALSRMAGAATGDLLCGSEVLSSGRCHPPIPLAAVALSATRQLDEVKLTSALARICQEDPSLKAEHKAETGEFIISGQGDLHLQIMLSRLQSEHGLSVSEERPALQYRETITRPGRQHSRHKKQSGGHGEFADVHLEISPQPRGSGFRFTERITGGVIPKQYIPAVQKGIESYLARGPLGFPVVDVAVALVDGSYHAVDSSDMAFQKAASRAMSVVMPQCGPVLLEPIVKVRIAVPSEFTPRVQRIVTGRRGQLLGFDAKSDWRGWDEVLALMPEAETHDMIVDLRSQSLGLGSYTQEFDHLQEVLGRALDQVLAARAGASR